MKLESWRLQRGWIRSWGDAGERLERGWSDGREQLGREQTEEKLKLCGQKLEKNSGKIR